jgi:outer membrane protein, multidrug efflux system
VSILVMALAAAAGCNLEPRYQRPALPVSDHFSTETAAVRAENPRTAAETGWREFFRDSRLQTLIQAALVNNRDLRVAVLNVARARELYRVERAARLPEIAATGDHTSEQVPSILSSQIGEAVTAHFYEVFVGIPSFEVDLLGRARSSSRAAFERYLADDESRRNVQLALVSEVATAYLTLTANQEALQLAKDTFQNQSDAFNLTRRMYMKGAASGLDFAQASTTVESARLDVAHYEGDVAQSTHELALLVGAEVGAETVPQNMGAQTDGVAELTPGLSSLVLLDRPDVLAAEHLLRAANADIGAARAALFPTITLTSGIGGASAQLSDLFKAGSREWNVTPTITASIFDAGRRRASLRLSHIDRDVALAKYEQAIQSGFREVADALVLEGTLARERDAAAALADSTARAYQLSRRRFEAGRDSYLVVLDSQRRYYSAQQALISIRLAEQVNRVTLYRALGGGWLEHSH